MIVRLMLGILLCGASAPHASADDAADIFFKEGVWGSGTDAPPLLLSTPQLEINFYLLNDISYGMEGKSALAKRASDLAFPGSIYTKFVSFKKAHFSFTVDGELRAFDPSHFDNNRLAIIFADIEKDQDALYAVNQLTYRSVLSREPGLTIETRSVYDRCGLFLFRNKNSALGAMLIIPPDAKREIAHYCVSYALLETIGFRGRVESLPEGVCLSARCSRRPKLTLTDWDASAIGALYGVDTPTYLTTHQRFRDVLQKQP